MKALAEKNRVLAELSARIDDMFRTILAGQTELCLLDFPDHPNVGDSAIYCGEVTAIRRVWKGSIRYVASFSSYDRNTLKAVSPDGILLIHGGGNIGEIYPHHHGFRLRMLREWVGRRLVQLPQTLYFSNQQADDEFARAIERHGNFHLVLRDRRSFEHANSRYACECSLVPDSAFALPSLSVSEEPSVKVLALCRTDAERRDLVAVDPIYQRNVKIADWPEEHHKLSGTDMVGRLGTFSSRHGLRSAIALANWSFERRAWRRLNVGLALLGDGQVVATDRLHAYVLALKLGKRFWIADNSYGKLSAIYESWLQETTWGTWASSLSEAIQLALIDGSPTE
jgi:exopolysaccharide biosynthesis predicted pyruvyltransferase EpsI